MTDREIDWILGNMGLPVFPNATHEYPKAPWATASTYTTRANETVTFESVKLAMEELGKLAPLCGTPEQRRWAKLAGFPDYPGYIVAQDVFGAIAAHFKHGTRDDVSLYAIPIMVEPKMPPGAIRSAEHEWEYLKKLSDSMWNEDMPFIPFTP